MIFNFGKSPHVNEPESSSRDYAIFQQISSSFQQVAMELDQNISIASAPSFVDKIKMKGMIIGIDRPLVTEDERVTQQSQEMARLIKSFQAEFEQNANHVSCRMHDFRCYLTTDAAPETIDHQAVYLRARDCVNQTLADMIVLKEQTKDKISKLTLNESDAKRMFTLFDNIEQAYQTLTTDMQAKLRLLNATLCH